MIPPGRPDASSGRLKLIVNNNTHHLHVFSRKSLQSFLIKLSGVTQWNAKW